MERNDPSPARPRTSRRRAALRACGALALAAAAVAAWNVLFELRSGRCSIPSERDVFRYRDWLERPYREVSTGEEIRAGKPWRKVPKPVPRAVPLRCLPRSDEAGWPERPVALEPPLPRIAADAWFHPAATQLVERLAPAGVLNGRPDRNPIVSTVCFGVGDMLQFAPSWAGLHCDFDDSRRALVLLADSPTREDLEEAREWLVHPDIDRIEDDGSPVLSRTILAYNPLVFHVPAGSSVTNLTTEQLKKIFVDRVPTWREAGVDAPGRVFAYERDWDDVAQRLAADWLKTPGDWNVRLNDDAPKRRRAWKERLRDPLRRYASESDQTEPFRVRPGAIGFSLMTQAAPFVGDGTIHLVAVDGAEPTAENIAKGLYPVGRALEFISQPIRSGSLGRNFRTLREYLLSEPGRRLIESAGFLPAPWWAPLPPVRENGNCDACAASLLGW